MGAWFGRGFAREYWQNWRVAAARSGLPEPIQYVSSTKPVTQPIPQPATTTKRAPTPVTPTPKLVDPQDPFVFSATLPTTVNLDVPFLSQAPQRNWELPYQEACEEAAAIMVDGFFRGRTAAFGPEEGNEAILSLVAYEKKLLGEYEDTSAAETVQFIKKYFGYTKVEVKAQPTVVEIKSALANGYPVIVPASGKALKNPYFKNGGPLYHMLVLKGYLADGRWITNDPGTRFGADYIYGQKVLMDALHDWNEGDVVHGTAQAIVVLPKE